MFTTRPLNLSWSYLWIENSYQVWSPSNVIPAEVARTRKRGREGGSNLNRLVSANRMNKNQKHPNIIVKLPLSVILIALSRHRKKFPFQAHELCWSTSGSTDAKEAVRCKQRKASQNFGTWAGDAAASTTVSKSGEWTTLPGGTSRKATGTTINLDPKNH